MIGPPRRWAHLVPAARICRAMAATMRFILRLRAYGLTRHEATLVLRGVLSAVEAQRGSE